MPARDQEEQDLRIDQMTVNIEKMRADLYQRPTRATLRITVMARLVRATYRGRVLGTGGPDKPGHDVKAGPGGSVSRAVGISHQEQEVRAARIERRRHLVAAGAGLATLVLHLMGKI
jgi:hypothetical protein